MAELKMREIREALKMTTSVNLVDSELGLIKLRDTMKAFLADVDAFEDEPQKEPVPCGALMYWCDKMYRTVGNIRWVKPSEWDVLVPHNQSWAYCEFTRWHTCQRWALVENVGVVACELTWKGQMPGTLREYVELLPEGHRARLDFNEMEAAVGSIERAVAEMQMSIAGRVPISEEQLDHIMRKVMQKVNAGCASDEEPEDADDQR